MSETMAETETRWVQHLKETFLGAKIIETRYMSPNECAAFGWSKRSPILVLDNGVIVYGVMDDEENDGAPLGAINPDGKDLSAPVLRA